MTAAARHAVWVLPPVLVLAMACVWFSANNLRINASHSSVVSAGAEGSRAYNDYQRAFPQFTDNLLVVIDSTNADLADSAQQRLAADLRAQPALFQQVYAPGNSEFFRRNSLLFLTPEELAERADRLAELRPLLSQLALDPSLGKFFGLLADVTRPSEPELAVDLDPMFDRLAAAFRANGKGQYFRLSWQELLFGLDQERTHRRFIELRPKLDPNAFSPAANAMQRVRVLADELALDAEHNLRVRLTGPAALESDERASVSRGALLGAVLALLAVGLILVLALRSFRLVLACLLSLTAGLAATAAVAAAVVGTLNLVSIAFVALYVGLGIDYAIHLTLRYRELIRANAPATVAMQVAAGDVGASLMVCALTTAVAFFSFIPTAYTAMAELGMIAGIGMFISLAATLTVAPAVLALMPLSTRGRTRTRTRAAISAWPQMRRRWIIAIAAGTAVASMGTLPWVTFNTNTLDLKNPRSESVATFRDLLQQAEHSPQSLAVLVPDLRAAQKLTKQLAAQPEVAAAISIADFVPEDQTIKLSMIRELSAMLALPEPAPLKTGAMVSHYRAVVELKQALNSLLESNPSARDGAAGRLDVAMEAWNTAISRTALLQRRDRVNDLHTGLLAGLPELLQQLRYSLNPSQISLNDLPADLHRRWVSDDGRYRVAVFPSAALDSAVKTRKFVQAVRHIAPDATGAAVLQVSAGQTVVQAFVHAFGYAVLGITLVLLMLLRSIVDTLRVLAPLALAALLVAAATVALGIPFNFANIIALPLLFGVGVDSAIHVVRRMRHAPPEGGLLLGSSTAKAVFYSALTTIAAFGALAFSQHPGIASLGLLLAIGMLAMLVCTLVVLPALLPDAEKDVEEAAE